MSYVRHRQSRGNTIRDICGQSIKQRRRFDRLGFGGRQILDGIVATIMAIGLASGAEVPVESIYERRGVMTI